MNSLTIIIGVGYVIILIALVVFSMKVIQAENIGLGWRTVLLTLIGISLFAALTTIIWIASNLEYWVQS